MEWIGLSRQLQAVAASLLQKGLDFTRDENYVKNATIFVENPQPEFDEPFESSTVTYPPYRTALEGKSLERSTYKENKMTRMHGMEKLV